MSSKPILYSYYRSSCSWRVRAALAVKGVEYEYKPINLISSDGGQQYSPEFKRINPLAQVPALVVNGDEVLAESMAIMEYIDEVYTTGPSLLPKDPILRAKARAIAQCLVSGVQPLQNLTVLKKVEQIKSKDSEPMIALDNKSWAQYWISNKFNGLESMLAQTSGICCIGNSLTIADLCLVPQVYNANRYGVDMKDFPIIAKINEYLLTIDAFKQTHPSAQPDCPPENK